MVVGKEGEVCDYCAWSWIRKGDEWIKRELKHCKTIGREGEEREKE